MPRYLLAFHGGHNFKSPVDARAYMQKWRQWSADLGGTIVDPGFSVGASKTVHAGRVTEDGGANPISGIMLIEAGDASSALDVAKSCPHLEIGGSIEIAEAMSMKM